MNITLTFTLDEINGLLTALGQLPYAQSAHFIGAIHNQAMPQIHAANSENVEIVEPEVVNG